VITFQIPGKPRGKQRARTFQTTKGVRTVTPEQTVNYENWVKMCFIQARPEGFKVYENAVGMEITVVQKKAKSNKMLHPCLTPDLDNVAKIICDSLNGLVYVDDKQVIELHIVRTWGAEEKVMVEIWNVIPF
jgi:Holliday junction resolvase RusA-like endonuclease